MRTYAKCDNERLDHLECAEEGVLMLLPGAIGLMLVELSPDAVRYNLNTDPCTYSVVPAAVKEAATMEPIDEKLVKRLVEEGAERIGRNGSVLEELLCPEVPEWLPLQILGTLGDGEVSSMRMDALEDAATRGGAVLREVLRVLDPSDRVKAHMMASAYLDGNFQAVKELFTRIDQTHIEMDVRPLLDAVIAHDRESETAAMSLLQHLR